MKLLIGAISALLLSTIANAGGLNSSDSWAAIQADNSYFVNAEYPVFGETGIFNACATDTELRAIQAVKVCVEYKHVPARSHNDMPSDVCVRTEMQFPSMARAGVASVCQEYGHTKNTVTDCIRYSNEAYVIPLTHNLEVIKNDRHYPDTAFYKDYTIPACK
jgi:hypothetical protein